MLLELLLRGRSCQGLAGLVVELGSVAVERCSACLHWCMVQAVAAAVNDADHLLRAVEGAAEPAAAVRERQSGAWVGMEWHSQGELGGQFGSCWAHHHRMTPVTQKTNTYEHAVCRKAS